MGTAYVTNNQCVSLCHEAARNYLTRGWSALAFCPPDHIGCGRKHRCDSPGKVPLGTWKRMQTERQPQWMLDLEFRNHPNANVGITLGEVSGLVGIDVDGPEGKDLLIKISNRDLPKTLCFQTSNGFRLLYALAAGEVPPANRKISQDGGRVEILSNGLCTVMPPSRHANGKSYAWVIGYSPEDRQASPLPSWILRTASSSMASAANGPITTFRNVRLFRAGCSLRRQGMDQVAILECLQILNQQCRPPLEDTEVQKIARNSAKYEPHDYGVDA